MTLTEPNPAARRPWRRWSAGEVHVSDDGRRLSAGVDASTGLATAVVRALDGAGVLVDNIEVRQPSLDDVFFSLTGGHLAISRGRSSSPPGANAAHRRPGPTSPPRLEGVSRMTTTTY